MDLETITTKNQIFDPKCLQAYFIRNEEITFNFMFLNYFEIGIYFGFSPIDNI
jgi:hypothetical protein